MSLCPSDIAERAGSRRHRTRAGSASLVLAVTLLGLLRAVHGESLGTVSARLDIDPAQVSVSGLSSGGYMAQQFHLVHSEHVSGAGIIAGGPYRCAAGSYPPYSWLDPTGLYAATSVCSNTNPYWFFQGPPDVAFSITETRREASAGNIDDPRHLRDDRIWLLSGSLDTTVPTSVMSALELYYLEFARRPDIRFEKIEDAGHAMITEDFGNACHESLSPYISDCDFDAAGELLAHIYGPLRPRARSWSRKALIEFDQSEFYDGDDPRVSMHALGHVYVPQPCLAGERCRLHVAFHGCQQSQDLIGDAFFAESGYNEWAQTNRIVVLYPQVTPWRGAGILDARANPKGCWDWWGYSGSDYHRRSGKQIRAVTAMINTLLNADLLAR